jgi:hypothetical protein
MHVEIGGGGRHRTVVVVLSATVASLPIFLLKTCEQARFRGGV